MRARSIPTPLIVMVLLLAVPAAWGQTVTVRDVHPRLVFTPDGSNGTRTYQDVRNVVNANGGSNPWRSEFNYWLTGTGYNNDPIHEASRYVATGSLSRAENALNLMVSGGLSYSDTENFAEQGLQWALAYDWIYSAWQGTTPPANLSGKLATIESKLASWVDSALDDLDTNGPSLWHGRAAVGAAAWIAALALPAGNSTYDTLRNRAWNHWGQTLKACDVIGGWDEGPTYWTNNRAVNFPLAVMSYTSAVTASPSLPVADPMDALRSFGYWQAYTERGDGSFNRYGDVAGAVTITNGTPGRSLDLYAMATGEPALAAWAQLVRDRYDSTPYHSYYAWMAPVGYDPNQPKPAGYDPADPGACLNDALPRAMVFGEDGLGQVVMKQGWDVGDTQISFKAGDYLAHHGHQDQGTFTMFKHSKLVINSGGYGGDYQGVHRLNYYVRTVSANSILIQRPDETWNALGVPPAGGYLNDGGQRLINQTGSVLPSYEYWVANKTSGKNYETGDITAFDNVDGDYSYVASNITRAYNSTLYDSQGQGGKVSLVTRQMVYLQDQDVLIVFDRVNSTDPAYKKKWLLHTPNKFIGGTESLAAGSSFSNGIIEVDGNTIAGDTMTMTNGSGKLFLQVLAPADYTVNKVGGTSWRYYVETDGNDADGYDGANQDGYTEQSYHDYGNWRIEISPKDPSNFDTFLNVLSPRASTTGSVAAGRVLEADAAATVMALGGRVIGFGTYGRLYSPFRYTLDRPGAYDHLLTDLGPGLFHRIDAGAAEMAYFANDEGVLTFGTDGVGGLDVTVTPMAAPRMGDANLDGQVGIADLSALADHYGLEGADWMRGDFTRDGLVGIADLSALADNYGSGSPVPEPGVLAMIGAGAAVLAGRRRKGRKGR